MERGKGSSSSGEVDEDSVCVCVCVREYAHAPTCCMLRNWQVFPFGKE